MSFRLKLYISSVYILACLLWLPLTAYSLDDDEAPVYREKLSRLQKSIVKIQEHLKSTRAKRSDIITDLSQLETTISSNALALKLAETNIQNLNNHVSQLKKELKKVSRKLQEQRTALADQIRSAYVLGGQQNLKIVLSQQNPSELGRLQIYFNYLSRVREQEIQQFTESMKTKQKIEKDLKQSLTTQKTALEKTRIQRNDLQKQRVKRNQLLAQLEIKINNQEQTLSDLETSRTRIEDLLMSLGQLLADIPTAPGDESPFGQLKGGLPWPVDGPFLANYGQDREQGGLKWNGVLIGAPYGTPVRAISHGRIAFADWLQGFGFISIVDHGNGYMSLYGHNESLLKQLGDWVTAGEEIATAGDSGGQPASGLYFEIRSRGKPVNPSTWCSKKVQHARSQ